MDASAYALAFAAGASAGAAVAWSRSRAGSNTASKLFTVLYIPFGLGVIAAFISELTKQQAALIARLRSHDTAAETDAGHSSRDPQQSQSSTGDERES